MEELMFCFLIFLSALFISSSFSKIRNYEEHKMVVKNYNLLPKRSISMFMFIEVSLELLTGIGLLLTPVQISSIYLAIIMLVIFTIAVAINLLRGRTNISCGCGGIVGNHQLSWKLVFRNLCLIVAGLTVLNLEIEIYSNWNWSVKNLLLFLITWTLVISFKIILKIVELRNWLLSSK